MKIEFEQEDMDAIAKRIADLLVPMLSIKKNTEEDKIFDIKALSEYLKIKPSWIYERTARSEIPFLKVGNHVRFRKKDIDKWLKEKSVTNVD